jgi:hypothetical protein
MRMSRGKSTASMRVRLLPLGAACWVAWAGAQRAHALPPPSVPPPSAAQRARACAELEARYRRLESRMRAGYGARGGEHLREQQRRLQARRWELHCERRAAQDAAVRPPSLL